MTPVRHALGALLLEQDRVVVRPLYSTVQYSIVTQVLQYNHATQIIKTRHCPSMENCMLRAVFPFFLLSVWQNNRKPRKSTVTILPLAATQETSGHCTGLQPALHASSALQVVMALAVTVRQQGMLRQHSWTSRLRSQRSWKRRRVMRTLRSRRVVRAQGWPGRMAMMPTVLGRRRQRCDVMWCERSL